MRKVSRQTAQLGLSRMGTVIIVLVPAVAIVGFLLVRNQQQNELAVTYNTAGATREISVTANGDEFSPNSFQIGHLEPVVLLVTAVDKDYVLEVPEGGIHAVLPQGQTTEVQIGTLGVGKFEFSCSAQCRGSIEVIPLQDEDNERPQ